MDYRRVERNTFTVANQWTLVGNSEKRPDIIVMHEIPSLFVYNAFLRQTPQQAESHAHLKELLMGRQANGIIFTTMQKFEESSEALWTEKSAWS